MSDEQSASPAAAGETETADDDSGDSLEPGGGPNRVVSEESVDDILESLDSTTSDSPDSAVDSSNAAATATDSSESVTAEFDETEIPAAEVDETDDEATGPAADTPSTDATAAATPETGAGGDTGTDAAEPATGDGASVEAAASSIPDDADLEDLAARVDDGSVTGADVRAAEAGEGRESTPEIDDVDLSMDDLETTAAGAATGVDEWPDDAGPLAGSVDADAGAETSDEDADDSPGLLGRLKKFFSR